MQHLTIVSRIAFSLNSVKAHITFSDAPYDDLNG